MTTSARDLERIKFIQRVNHHEGELKRAIIDLERFDEVSTLMGKAPVQEAQQENKDPRIRWDTSAQEQTGPSRAGQPGPELANPVGDFLRGGFTGRTPEESATAQRLGWEDATVPIWAAEKKEMDEFIKPFHAIYGYNREFAKLLNEMARTHISKNRDYASDENHYSNFEYAEQVARPFKGIDAVFATIIGIKLARISELRKGKTPNNEPLRDSYKDLSVYVGLWTSYRRMTEDNDARRGCDSPIKR